MRGGLRSVAARLTSVTREELSLRGRLRGTSRARDFGPGLFRWRRCLSGPAPGPDSSGSESRRDRSWFAFRGDQAERKRSSPRAANEPDRRSAILRDGRSQTSRDLAYRATLGWLRTPRRLGTVRWNDRPDGLVGASCAADIRTSRSKAHGSIGPDRAETFCTGNGLFSG